MRWFKHMTNSSSDEKLCLIFDSLGLEGYGFYWRILEVIGQQMDKSSKTFCQYSPKTWAKFAGVSAKKCEKFFRIFEKHRLFLVKFKDDSILVDCPNLLKYKDEYSTRPMREGREMSGQTPDGIGTNSRRETETETEADTETEKDTLTSSDVSDDPPERCPHSAIICQYHKILPQLPKVKEWTPSRQALLRARWNENRDRQCIEWWTSFFETVAQSDFLTGRAKEFRADLEWLIRPKNFPKVVEGRYANHGSNGRPMTWGEKKEAELAAQGTGTETTGSVYQDYPEFLR